MNLKLLIPLLLPLALGLAVLTRLLDGSRLPLKRLFIALFAPAAGYALISLVFFLCYVFRAGNARLLAAVFPWFLLIPFLIRPLLGPSRPASSVSLRLSLRPCFFGGFKTSALNFALSALCWVLAALFAYVLFHFLQYLAGYMSWNAFGGWDARYFWFLKARFYFRDPEEWRLMFSPWLWWSNNDYPLMVPGLMAWGWNLLGREMLIWPMILSAVFVLSLGGLILWYLAAARSWTTALAAGLFFLTTQAYRFWAGTLYCDIPFAFFATASALLLVTALRLKETRLFGMAAFLAGCSAWTKNEGILFLIVFGLLTAGFLAAEAQRDRRQALRIALALAAGLALPLFACAYFKIFLTGGQTYLIQKKTAGDFIAALTDGPRNEYILASFVAYKANWQHWHGLWFLFLAALAYWPFSRKLAPAPYSWLPALMLIAMELGYAVVFTLTPNVIQKHIHTALLRLLLQTGALAIVFIFETFGFQREIPPACPAALAEEKPGGRP